MCRTIRGVAALPVLPVAEGRGFLLLSFYANDRWFGQTVCEAEPGNVVFRAWSQTRFRRMVLDRDKERAFTEQTAEGAKAPSTRKRR